MKNYLIRRFSETCHSERGLPPKNLNRLGEILRYAQDDRGAVLKAVILSAVILTSTNAIAEDRDPFSPTKSIVASDKADKNIKIKTGNDKVKSSVNPLTSNKLGAYKLVGTIISKNKSLGLVKSIDGTSFTVEEGDSIGSEGGFIDEVTLDGLTINVDDRDIEIVVSNKIDVVKK